MANEQDNEKIKKELIVKIQKLINNTYLKNHIRDSRFLIKSIEIKWFFINDQTDPPMRYECEIEIKTLREN